MRRSRGLATLLAALGAAIAVSPAASAQGLRAGAASADITPPVGTPMFAYTARSGIANPGNAEEVLTNLLADPAAGLYAKTFVPSRGIHTRVRARAIVLERDGRRYALAQADLGGLPYALTRAVLDRIGSTGITGDRLLLSATHTHSSTGPIWPSDSGGYALLGGDLLDPTAFALTADGIARAIVDAAARLEPARAGVGAADAVGASRNRNFRPFRRNSDVPQDEQAARAVSVDPTVTVLRLDTLDGRPLAVWSNFAIHPTSFGDENRLFSGDNPGFAERIAETEIARAARRTGGSAADAPVNVWTNGAEGDVSPAGGPDLIAGREVEYAPSSFAGAHIAGRRTAAGIVAAWRDAGRRLTPDLPLDARRSFLAFDGSSADGEPVGPLAALGFGGIVGPDGACAPVDGLAGPGQGRKQPLLLGAGLVPGVVPVSVWRIGPLAIGAFPSEITKQMGRRIADRLVAESGGLADRAVIAGLTNGYISYTATPEEYDACHYEGSFTLFGRRQGARISNFASGLLDALVDGRPAPPGAGEPPAFLLPTGSPPAPEVTRQAGVVVEEPAERVRRLERATFRWRGGAARLDPEPGVTFVTIERRTAAGRFERFATDDGFEDIVEQDDEGVWTETFQLGRCTPLGSYRFVVTGRADRGSGVQPYTVVSRPFEVVRSAPLAIGRVAIARRRATVSAEYPDPGEDALLATPRIVRDGSAHLRVRPRRGRARTITARPNRGRVSFVATVPRRARVTVTRVRDRCGNTGP